MAEVAAGEILTCWEAAVQRFGDDDDVAASRELAVTTSDGPRLLAWLREHKPDHLRDALLWSMSPRRREQPLHWESRRVAVAQLLDEFGWQQVGYPVLYALHYADAATCERVRQQLWSGQRVHVDGKFFVAADGRRMGMTEPAVAR